jgi:hypothetical protein
LPPPLKPSAGAYIGSNKQYQIPKRAAAAERSSTQGGNWLCVGSQGLHSLWDSAYVDKGMTPAQAATSSDFAAALTSKTAAVAPSPGDVLGWPQAWANESLQMARRELADLTGTSTRAKSPKRGCEKLATPTTDTALIWNNKLPPSYAASAADQVPQRLSEAGARLAKTLLTIWP